MLGMEVHVQLSCIEHGCSAHLSTVLGEKSSEQTEQPLAASGVGAYRE